MSSKEPKVNDSIAGIEQAIVINLRRLDVGVPTAIAEAAERYGCKLIVVQNPKEFVNQYVCYGTLANISHLKHWLLNH